MSINGVVALPPASPTAMPPFGVSEIRKRTNALQEVMRGVMKEGTHYGTIPGTPKPSLWKAGAEVLCMTFRLAPMLDSQVVMDDLDSEWPYTATKRDGSIVQGTSIGFFEVEATCTIHGPQGDVLSRCSARCNNREAKYRALSLFEIRNTILKMAEKRAFVSAVLMATGASDIFTQDLEDLPELVEPQVLAKVVKHQRPTQDALSTKREAWLIRAAQEAKLPDDAVERCLAYLRSSESKVVKAFFDDLSRRKPVFQTFLKKAE
ncbi:MAG TPA: hypothetical protein VGK03_11065 [Geothrix sp.]|jgi:hypothetical protein